MAKIFISYSRKDIEFAKKLTGELQESGLDFWVDWEGIPPTVDWMLQIEKGIEDADTFVFILSPDSVQSKICKEEIEHAVKNGKRLIPIVARDIKGEEAPTELSHLNWIFFRESDDFEAASTKLMTAIQTDYEWAQTQGRLQVKALEWERNHREASFLLRGKDLNDAELQLATNTSKEPHPTDLQRDYVFNSRQAADRSRRITTGISVAGIIALAALAVFGLVMASRATASAIEANNQAAVALTAKAEAETAKIAAEKAQKKAEAESRIANSGRLALESKSALTDFPQRALLLALEAVRINEDANEPVRPDAEEALRLAAERVSGIGLTGFSHEVSLVQFTDDNRWLVAGTTAVDGEIKIWNFDRLLNEPGYQPYYITFPVKFDDNLGNWTPKAYLSPQTSWLVVSGEEQTELWKIDAPNEDHQSLTFQGEIEFANSDDDHNILERQTDKVVLWRIDPEDLTRKELATFDGKFTAFSQDRKYLVTDDPQKGLLLWDFSSPTTPSVLLTPAHAADYRSILIDPNNRWLILLQDIPRADIQIPTYANPANELETEAWKSTNIVLIPLDQKDNPPQYKAELDIAIDLTYMYPKFSPDGNTLAFIGYSSPDAYGNSGASFGVMKFNNLEYSYQLYSKKDQYINVLSFVNKDWLYISAYDNTSADQKNTLLDLRQEELFSGGVDIATPLLVDNNREVKFSEDGKSMLTENGELIDFEQLDFNHAIVLNPAPETSAMSEQNDLLLELTNNPHAAGLEDTVTVYNQSPDNQWFAAGTRDGSLRLWNNINPWNSSNIHLAETTSYIAFSNDNKWMVMNNILWQLKDGRPDLSYPFEGQTLPLIAVFSPDSRWLVYIHDARVSPEADFLLQAKLIDLTKVSGEDPITATVIGTTTNSLYGVIQFSADSHWLMIKGELFFSDQDSLDSFVYDLENKKSHPLPYRVTNFAFTPDQKHMVLIGESHQTDGSFSLQNPEIWKLPANNSEVPEKIGKIETSDSSLISQNGRWLLSVPAQSFEGETSLSSNLWDLNCVIEKRECVPFVLPATQAGFSPDSSHLIVGYQEENDPDKPLTFDVWDLQNWNQANKPEKVYSSQTRRNTPSISRNGNLLVFGAQSTNYINPAGMFSTWGGYDGIGFNVTTFDGYGKLVFGGGGGGGYIPGSFQTDYSVEAFVLENIAQKPSTAPISLRGHESNISTSQISPNEKFVLTYSGADRDNGGAAEKLLRLWNLEQMRLDPTTKAVILPLDIGADGYIKMLAFTPDSRWIYIVDGTNTMHYFPTSIEDMKEQACIAVGRNFIINEWQRFFPNTDYRKTCENLPKHPSAITE